jgi:hypothetical protein
MSSGAVVFLAPAVGVVALGAVVVVGAAAGAVLALRAANKALESGVRAVGDYGLKVEGEIARLEAAEAEALRWEYATGDVLTINARIRILAEQAKSAGVATGLPEPIKLGACLTLDQLRAEAARVQTELVKAQEAVDAATVLPKLTAVVAGQSMRDADIAARLAQEETMRTRYERPVAVSPAPVPAEDIAQIIALLDADASAEERAVVLTLASAARERKGPYLTALRKKVDGEINPKVARRRLAAVYLQTLEEDPVASVIAGIEPSGPLEGTLGRLRAVVRGESDLDDGLRAEATGLLARSEKIAEQQMLRDIMIHRFEELGYAVDTVLDARDVVGVRMTRAEWNGEHTAEMVIDGGVVKAQLVSEVQSDGDAARITGTARCEGFVEHLEQTAGQVVESGHNVTVDVKSHLPAVRSAETGGGRRNTAPLRKQRSVD